MDWITEASTKHKDLIRRLGIHAPLEEKERVHFYQGVEIALAGYIEKKEIAVIIEEAEALSADLWDDNDD